MDWSRQAEGNPPGCFPERCCPDQKAGQAPGSVGLGYDQGKTEREKLRRMERGGGEKRPPV